MSPAPRLSIGMPVYNGAATIGPAIEALLAQSFDDFELIVGDNASTDSTGEVVGSLARRDRRIRYLRHPANIGANLNYTHVARVAQGEYLKWASSSDWCAPTFLESCLAALEQDPTAVLAVPRTRLFEVDPANARDCTDDIEILEDTPLERLVHLVDAMRLNHAINGVIRMSALRRTRLIEPYFGADIVLMGHLALLGKFLLLDTPLFYRRHEAHTSTALQDEAAKHRHHYPVPTVRSLFQGLKRHAGWFRAAASAPMPAGERARVMAYVVRLWYWERHALVDDLRGVWRYATRSSG